MKTGIAVALAAAASALAVSAAAAQEVELSLAHWVGATHPLQVTGMEPWATSIAEASGGRIKITIYPAAQLGAAADHYDMARDGIADIAFVNPGYQPGRFPVIAAGELPFTIANAKGGSRALAEWYQDYAAAEMSDVHVCLVHLHDPGTIHSKRGPLLVPSDLQGLNIRPSHATFARFITSLGAASVPGAAGEMRDMLEKGTADATASPWNSLFTFGAQDLVTHHLDLPLYATTFAFVMNKATYEGLEEQDRAVIDAHCTPEWSERMAAQWADIERAGRQKIIDLGGHTLYQPDAGQLELWKEAAAPLLEHWKQAVAAKGLDAAAVYARLVETLKAHGAYAE